MMKGACGGELSLAYFLTPFTVTKVLTKATLRNN